MLRIRLLTLLTVLALTACGSGRVPPSVAAFNANLRPVLPVLYDEPPVVKRSVPIAYPGVRLQEGDSGATRMAFTINTDGYVENYDVIESTHPAFAGYVQKRLNQWRFQPARKNGKPVPQRFVQLFSFQVGTTSAPREDRSRRIERDPSDDGPQIVEPVED